MLSCIAGVSAIFLLGVWVRSQWLGLLGLAMATAVAYQCASAETNNLWVLLGIALMAEAVIGIQLFRGLRREITVEA